jgi:hypothetical protein
MKSVNLKASVAPSKKCECGNCEWKGKAADTKPVKAFFDRVSPGETVPVGECPDCGALAHFVKPRKPIPVIVSMSGGTIQEVCVGQPGVELDVIFLDDNKPSDDGSPEWPVKGGQFEGLFIYTSVRSDPVSPRDLIAVLKADKARSNDDYSQSDRPLQTPGEEKS